MPHVLKWRQCLFQSVSSSTRHTHTHGHTPLANPGVTKLAASQVQWGTWERITGALTQSPPCHRRWHFSPSPDPLRVVPASVCRNPLRVKKEKRETTKGERTWEKNCPRERGGKGVERYESTAGGTRGPYPAPPAGVVDTGSIRGSSSANAFTSAPLESSVWRLEREGKKTHDKPRKEERSHFFSLSLSLSASKFQVVRQKSVRTRSVPPPRRRSSGRQGAVRGSPPSQSRFSLPLWTKQTLVDQRGFCGFTRLCSMPWPPRLNWNLGASNLSFFISGFTPSTCWNEAVELRVHGFLFSWGNTAREDFV